MVYILETEIPNDKKVIKSLKTIYGIGNKKTKSICKKQGILKNLKTSKLLLNQINNLSQYILDSKILITNNLKKKKNIRFQQLVSIKSFRGLRKLKGLPVRGQRTHTNSKSAKKLNKKMFK